MRVRVDHFRALVWGMQVIAMVDSPTSLTCLPNVCYRKKNRPFKVGAR